MTAEQQYRENQIYSRLYCPQNLKGTQNPKSRLPSQVLKFATNLCLWLHWLTCNLGENHLKRREEKWMQEENDEFQVDGGALDECLLNKQQECFDRILMQVTWIYWPQEKDQLTQYGGLKSLKLAGRKYRSHLSPSIWVSCVCISASPQAFPQLLTRSIFF